MTNDEIAGLNYGTTKVLILGGTHTIEINNKLHNSVIQKKPEIILTEGVKGHAILGIENIKKAPLTSICVYLYFRFLQIFGKDDKSLTKLADELGVKIIGVDANLDDLLNLIQGPFEYVIETLAVIGCVYYIQFHKLDNIGIASTIIFFAALLLLILVIRTFSYRNKIMVQKSIEEIKKNHIKVAFFYCGKRHEKKIKEMFENAGAEVEIIK